jgi:cephalosporin hydroxylase
MGVKTLTCINDLWIYQEIIYRNRPDVIIEIGSYCGGSTLFLANLLDLIGHGEVISVDICRDFYNVNHPRVHMVTGDCSSREVVDQINEIVDGRTVMVIHDGDHSYDAVLRDLEIYAPLVSAGHYIIVEDGLVDIYSRDRYKFSALEKGPLLAVESFIRKWETQFEIDEGSERFLITANPKGFLRRKAA